MNAETTYFGHNDRLDMPVVVVKDDNVAWCRVAGSRDITSLGVIKLLVWWITACMYVSTVCKLCLQHVLERIYVDCHDRISKLENKVRVSRRKNSTKKSPSPSATKNRFHKIFDFSQHLMFTSLHIHQKSSYGTHKILGHSQNNFRGDLGTFFRVRGRVSVKVRVRVRVKVRVRGRVRGRVRVTQEDG